MSEIIIVDYGMGNLASIRNMIKKVGGSCKISAEISDVLNAEKLILPGVGSFDAGMQNLHDRGLFSALNASVLEKQTPIMGICLGAQLMTQSSEEGNLSGLGWFDARTVRFNFDSTVDYKIPHMGWNRINIQKKHLIMENATCKSRFYFAHSYHFVTNEENISLCSSNYCYEFDSGLAKENIIALQFHPEKSHNFGFQLMKQFVAL